MHSWPPPKEHLRLAEKEEAESWKKALLEDLGRINDSSAETTTTSEVPS